MLYVAPGPVVEALTGGRVPAERLAYSDSFTSPLRMWWLVGVLVVMIGLHLSVAAQGRWHPGTSLTRIFLLVLIGSQLGWHVHYGNIFADPEVEQLVVPWVEGVAAVCWIIAGIAFYRLWTSVRPAPAMDPA